MPARSLERAFDTLLGCDTTYSTLTDTLLYDDCSSATGWAVYSTAIVTSVSGQLDVSSATPAFGWGTARYFTTQAGVTYTVSFYLDMGTCAGSNVRSEVIDNTFSASTFGSYTTSGSYSYTFTATGAGFGGITFVKSFPAAACGFKIDSILITYDTLVVDTIVCDTTFGAGRYRYAFNGMEKDDDVKGDGNSYTTKFRQYDARLGRWMSIDPESSKYTSESPYVAYHNNPIAWTDPEGDDPPVIQAALEKGSKSSKTFAGLMTATGVTVENYANFIIVNSQVPQPIMYQGKIYMPEPKNENVAIYWLAHELTNLRDKDLQTAVDNELVNQLYTNDPTVMTKDQFADKKIALETESVRTRLLVGAELDDISAYSEREQTAIKAYKESGDLAALEKEAKDMSQNATVTSSVDPKKQVSIREYWHEQYDSVVKQVDALKEQEKNKKNKDGVDEEKKDK